MPNWKRLLLASGLAHFSLIIAVCSRDTLSIAARGFTSLPPSFDPYAQQAETTISGMLGDYLAPANPVRQTLNLYLHATGIDVGYGFFAPNVPDNYKLVFELHYPDGKVGYELPEAASPAAGFRLATLLDNIGDAQQEELRELLVRMMAYSIWRQHPDAVKVRAVLGLIVLPSPAEAKHGTRESYHATHAYDFVFSRE